MPTIGWQSLEEKTELTTFPKPTPLLLFSSSPVKNRAVVTRNMWYSAAPVAPGAGAAAALATETPRQAVVTAGITTIAASRDARFDPCARRTDLGPRWLRPAEEALDSAFEDLFGFGEIHGESIGRPIVRQFLSVRSRPRDDHWQRRAGCARSPHRRHVGASRPRPSPDHRRHRAERTLRHERRR